MSLLVGGVHGQFDAIPLLRPAPRGRGPGAREARRLRARPRRARSPRSRSRCCCCPSSPWPAARPGARRRATPCSPSCPAPLLLAALRGRRPRALRRELFGYSGDRRLRLDRPRPRRRVARDGRAAAQRGARSGRPRPPLSKALFLAAWAALLVAVQARPRCVSPRRGRSSPSCSRSASSTASQSAQYLLWVVPARPRCGRAAGRALRRGGDLGPRRLLPLPRPRRPRAPALSTAGRPRRRARVGLRARPATLVASAAWLAAVLREGPRRLPRGDRREVAPVDLALAVSARPRAARRAAAARPARAGARGSSAAPAAPASVVNVS